KSQSIVERAQDRWLSVMIVFGVILAFTCVFLFHPVHYLLSTLRLDLRHFELWELGALLWTMSFLIYYFNSLSLTHKDGPDKKIILCWCGILASTFFSVLSLAVVSLGHSIQPSHWSTELERTICYIHIFCVAGVVFCIMLMD